MPKLDVYYQDAFFGENQTSPCLDEKTVKDWFIVWLECLKEYLPEAESYELTLRLSDDAEIQNLNNQYRNKNQPTDVLAFATLEVEAPQPVEEEPLYLGDIIISVNTASESAKHRGHSLKTELAWLAAHGFLHLLGWDHPSEESLIEMLSQQETLLQTVGLIPLDYT